MRYQDFPVGFRWNAGFDLRVCKGITQPVGVIAIVGQQHLSDGHVFQQRSGTGVVAYLTCREKQGAAPTLAFADRMRL
jgi:hypothetical protein